MRIVVIGGTGQQELLTLIARFGLRPGDLGDAMAFAKHDALRLGAEKTGVPVATAR